MRLERYTCEFITPAFCAGADQAEAEIRAAEVRGQLRWWYRCLAPEDVEPEVRREMEQRVFGGTAGSSGQASALQVRTRLIQRGPAWNPPYIHPESDAAYVYHFASVSGKKPGQPGVGPRWSANGNLPPGTKFEIQIRPMRPIPEVAELTLKNAMEAFLLLGGLGLRVTRGLGAFQCEERPATEAALEHCRSMIQARAFEWRIAHQDLQNWTSAIDAAGNLLRHKLRAAFSAGRGGDRPTPLGSSKPRQTSAVYLRPVRRPDSSYSLVVFEAPANRVLGLPSRAGSPALSVID
jgi:CRISPR/Cas system CMR-associated protein Cmr1 (group 7 of RAMP superfamily)